MRGSGCEPPLNLSPKASSNVTKESKNTLAIQSGNLQGDKLNLNRSRWDACPGAWLKLRQIDLGLQKFFSFLFAAWPLLLVVILSEIYEKNTIFCVSYNHEIKPPLLENV